MSQGFLGQAWETTKELGRKVGDVMWYLEYNYPGSAARRNKIRAQYGEPLEPQDEHGNPIPAFKSLADIRSERVMSKGMRNGP